MLNMEGYAKPYDDEDLKYNYDEHRYVLTYEGSTKSNIELNEVMYSVEFVNNYLDLLSRTVYAILFKNKDSKYFIKHQWVLAHSKEFRKSIKVIFMDLMWYNYSSGGFMTLYQSGVNLNEMKQLDLTIDKGMSVISNQMATNFGINERILRNINIAENETYETFGLWKQAMLDKNIITQEQFDKLDYYEGFIFKDKYTCFKDELEGNFIIKDSSFWKKQLSLRGSSISDGGW